MNAASGLLMLIGKQRINGFQKTKDKMKKYLKEISTAGIILLFIGVVIGRTAGTQYGAFPCAFGLLLAIVVMVYKAFHWKEYERENKRNIAIMLGTIILLYIMMIML